MHTERAIDTIADIEAVIRAIIKSGDDVEIRSSKDSIKILRVSKTVVGMLPKERKDSAV